MEKDIQKAFGLRVKEFRKKAGLSQVKLSELAEIDRTYLPSIERGERNISILVAYKLAKALKIEMKELFNF